jgi:hypothetical protein
MEKRRGQAALGMSSPAHAGDAVTLGAVGTGCPAGAGHDNSEMAPRQFGTAALGLGGNAALTRVPRSRS